MTPGDDAARYSRAARRPHNVLIVPEYCNTNEASTVSYQRTVLVNNRLLLGAPHRTPFTS